MARADDLHSKVHYPETVFYPQEVKGRGQNKNLC